jgi:hypothetical protein
MGRAGSEVYTGVEDTRGIARPAYYTKKNNADHRKAHLRLPHERYTLRDRHGVSLCNAKLLWNDIISQITNILITKPVKNCFILCKNYHTVHKEP